ncbi:hypothetical protein E2C01_085765 [Portunus trituberculatus]|uniref:Uncharacterized protein n=1 Tax=Portunus trituberculatus TaxID=210409 RepID=A0A5B7J9S1_PORTR|nr:hypothetical protein [Portunus trituberculatus]
MNGSRREGGGGGMRNKVLGGWGRRARTARNVENLDKVSILQEMM